MSNRAILCPDCRPPRSMKFSTSGIDDKYYICPRCRLRGPVYSNISNENCAELTRLALWGKPEIMSTLDNHPEYLIYEEENGYEAISGSLEEVCAEATDRAAMHPGSTVEVFGTVHRVRYTTPESIDIDPCKKEE